MNKNSFQIGSPFLASGFHLPASGLWLPASGFWPPASGFWITRYEL